MKSRAILFLMAVAVIEGIIIIDIILHPNYFRRIQFVTTNVAIVNPSPLFWALHYDAPDGRFEQLVKQNPDYVRYSEPGTGWTALADCVVSGRTNCVRILIANGASFDESLQAARKVNRIGYVVLLERAKSELR
jgi:hypothetical protein